MSTMQVVVLAAGKGTRLGGSVPKPLTVLRDGRSILRQQLDGLRAALGEDVPIRAVVGFQAEVVMRAAPDVAFVHNEEYDRTNTSKSLLRGLLASAPGGVLWLNGDVVFHPDLLQALVPWLEQDRTFVCVNRSAVADEEVKYTVDTSGHVDQLSKTVIGGLGEAVGINYVSAADKAALIEHLAACAPDDYFERALETGIAAGDLRVIPVDVTAFDAVEVDFQDDLRRANLIEMPGALPDLREAG